MYTFLYICQCINRAKDDKSTFINQ